MTTVEILRKAKQILEERGWRAGDYWRRSDGKGPCCLLGACVVAAFPDDYQGFDRALGLSRVKQAENIVIPALKAVLGDEVCPSTWNDKPGRTLPEVLDAFDRAIALASQPQGPGEGNG